MEPVWIFYWRSSCRLGSQCSDKRSVCYTGAVCKVHRSRTIPNNCSFYMQTARHFALVQRIENILLHSSFHFSRVQWLFELKIFEKDENSINKNRISIPRNSLAVTTVLSISSTIELYKQFSSAATSTGTKWHTSLAAFPTYSIATASDRCFFSSNIWFGQNSSDSDTNPDCKTHRN